MTVSRASPGAKLLSTSTRFLQRFYSTATSPSSASIRPTPKAPSRSRKNTSEGRSPEHTTPRPQNAYKRAPKPAEKPAMMVVPASAKRFATHTGNLRTTPENWAFLHEMKIEYDNSIATKLNLGSENSRIISNFTTKVFYSPSHIMNPHHLQYLDPRDHPLGESIRSKYKRKVQEEPLWVIMTDQNGDTGLVRSIAKRRLTAAFWTAMKELGYERFPEPGSPQIKGTVLVKISNAQAASNFPASRFGDAVAKAVEQRWKMEQEKLDKETRQQEKPKSAPKPRIQW